MREIILRNGSTEEEPLVVIMMLSLGDLLEESPILFYELVMKCRDCRHQFFGNAATKLEELGLIQNGSVHDSIRNIVLSAVEGDGLEMTLRSPIPERSES